MAIFFLAFPYLFIVVFILEAVFSFEVLDIFEVVFTFFLIGWMFANFSLEYIHPLSLFQIPATHTI